MALLDSNMALNGWKGVLSTLGRAFVSPYEGSALGVRTAASVARNLMRGEMAVPASSAIRQGLHSGFGSFGDWFGRTFAPAYMANWRALTGPGTPLAARALAAGRIGAAALGAYALPATAYRLLRGGSLSRDEYGRPDIPFLPFF